jgi:HAD superfamily 5'-nucleotidase-like hydrolase
MDTARGSDPASGPAAYDAPLVQELLATPHGAHHREVPRTRQIFVNRNLRMDKIEAVGFDMDYTLAMYHLQQLETLAFRMTLARMISTLGYPAVIGTLQYDAEFVIRGLVVDKLHGNIFKMDRHNHVGRCYHGRRPVPEEELRRLYRGEKVHLSAPRFAWIDTLFALPEACLFAEVIELLEGQGGKVDYTKLFDDIRESIDTVHRDGSLKAEVKKDLGRYVLRDPELGPSLHKLRSGGKKLFLLTNSLFDYTDEVMRYVLDGQLGEYPSWRNYFDVVVTGAAKPAFFSERRPMFLLGPDGARSGEATTLERGRAYEGGDLGTFERLWGISGERILYVGDHIYGDILRSKKSSRGRTCVVGEERERELAWIERNQEVLAELARLEQLRVRVEDGSPSIAPPEPPRPPPRPRRGGRAERERVEAERAAARSAGARVLRRARRDADARDALERQLEKG